MKKVTTILLFLFIAASILFLVIKELSAEKSEVAKAPVESGSYTNVYYFHTTNRCISCKKIESYTKEAVLGGFGQQIASGELYFKEINVQEPGNMHFVDEFKLHTKSVVFQEVKDGVEGRWKNLDKVWKLLGDKKQFQDYVTTELKTFMGEKK